MSGMYPGGGVRGWSEGANEPPFLGRRKWNYCSLDWASASDESIMLHVAYHLVHPRALRCAAPLGMFYVVHAGLGAIHHACMHVLRKKRRNGHVWPRNPPFAEAVYVPVCKKGNGILVLRQSTNGHFYLILCSRRCIEYTLPSCQAMSTLYRGWRRIEYTSPSCQAMSTLYHGWQRRRICYQWGSNLGPLDRKSDWLTIWPAGLVMCVYVRAFWACLSRDTLANLQTLHCHATTYIISWDKAVPLGADLIALPCLTSFCLVVYPTITDF